MPDKYSTGRIAKDAITTNVPCAFDSTANQVTGTTVVGAMPAGIPMDTYAAGQVVGLKLEGIVKVKITTAASIVAGSPLMVSTTSGGVALATVKNWAFGFAMQTPAADGDIIECLYAPHYYAKDAA